MKERLQKIIAKAGIASRRQAERLILDGKVTVNGKTVSQLGTQVDPLVDHVKVGGRRIQAESLEYYAVNKPKNYLCSVSDPGKRPLVTDLVKSSRRLFPAGRLDFDSEGLVILTNDGALMELITKPGRVEKKYRVKVRGNPSERKLSMLRKGLRTEDEKFFPCQVQLLKKGNNCWFEVILKQGRNRQIRRMFDAIGHSVMRLRRTGIGIVDLGGLPPGTSRSLRPSEIAGLQNTRPRKK